MTSDGTVDAQDMLGVVEASPDQWSDALAAASAADVRVPAGARAVVVVGMGGSGIAGQVAQSLATAAGPTPVVPVRDYRIPAWCGPDTPVVAVSHSGNTEETLAAAEQALAAGCPLVAITSGGRLAELAGAAGAPVAALPGGGQPRASVGLLTVPLLVALERGGHLPGILADLEQVPEDLRRVRRSWGEGPADVARRIGDRVPVFVGGAGISGVIAQRARCQVNENSERPALDANLPEADHNAIVGWGGRSGASFTAIEVLDEAEHPRTLLRHRITADVLGEALPVLHQLRLTAGTPIGRLAEGVLWVDLLSVHLALLDGVDPTPVTRIATLKERMTVGG